MTVDFIFRFKFSMATIDDSTLRNIFETEFKAFIADGKITKDNYNMMKTRSSFISTIISKLQKDYKISRVRLISLYIDLTSNEYENDNNQSIDKLDESIEPLTIETEFQDGQSIKPFIKENEHNGDHCYESIESYLSSNDNEQPIYDKSETKPNINYDSFISSMNSLNIINTSNYKDEQLRAKLFSIYQQLTNYTSSMNEFNQSVDSFYLKLEENDKKYELPDRDEKAYYQALIEKYPILKTKKRWDFRIDDNISLFSGDSWGMTPVVKVGKIFGLGEAEVVSSGSDHYYCEFKDSESPLAEINQAVNNYHVDIDQEKLLEDMIDSIRDYTEGWDDVIESIRSASTIEALISSIEKLHKMSKSVEEDIYQINLFGGLVWSNIEEARHVVELMSLYFRLDFVYSDNEEDEELYLVLRPESTDDWKKFSVKEHKSWYELTREERDKIEQEQEVFGFYLQGINLINLESIYKYHQLTGQSIIPKSIIVNFHHDRW